MSPVLHWPHIPRELLAEALRRTRADRARLAEELLSSLEESDEEVASALERVGAHEHLNDKAARLIRQMTGIFYESTDATAVRTRSIYHPCVSRSQPT